MTRILTATAIAAGLASAGAAFANGDSDKCFDKGTLSYVDCPTERVAEAPLPVWTGLYAGIHAGYADVTFDGEFDDGAVVDFSDLSGGGFMGGGQVGYLHQYQNDLVLGLELSGSYVGVDGSASDGVDDSASASLDYLLEARLRAGVALYGEDIVALPYLTGGVAMAGYEADVISGGASSDPGTLNIDGNTFGGVVGGGLEFMLTPTISTGVEGLYYFINDETALPFDGVVGDHRSLDLDGAWSARARLNFGF